MIPIERRWPPRAGDRFPHFELYDAASAIHRIPDGPSLLVFYRGYWCSHCRRQLSELAREADHFTYAGLRIIAISTGTRDDMEPMAALTGNQITLLSNPCGCIVRDLGLEDRSETHPRPVPLPAVYFLDDEGVVQYQYVGRDAGDRPMLELLKLAASNMPQASQRSCQ